MSSAKGNRSIMRLLKRKKIRRALAVGGYQVTGRSTNNKQEGVCFKVKPERRWEIISAYGRVLERCSSSIERESSLPFPKDLIRQAIYEELIDNPANELRNHLEIAFVQLEAFLPHEEFKVIEEFKLAGKLAEEMASSGDPDSIIASAGILKKVKGDKAVLIQEAISEKMKKRLKQITAIKVPVFSMGACPASARL